VRAFSDRGVESLALEELKQEGILVRRKRKKVKIDGFTADDLTFLETACNGASYLLTRDSDFHDNKKKIHKPDAGLKCHLLRSMLTAVTNEVPEAQPTPSFLIRSVRSADHNRYSLPAQTTLATTSSGAPSASTLFSITGIFVPSSIFRARRRSPPATIKSIRSIRGVRSVRPA